MPTLYDYHCDSNYLPKTHRSMPEDTKNTRDILQYPFQYWPCPYKFGHLQECPIPSCGQAICNMITVPERKMWLGHVTGMLSKTMATTTQLLTICYFFTMFAKDEHRSPSTPVLA